jgi:ABC-type multidrug transport system permease subunit
MPSPGRWLRDELIFSLVLLLLFAVIVLALGLEPWRPVRE